MGRKIGFIGLGTMGRPMAANLIKARHNLRVFDLDSSAMEALVNEGAAAAASAREAAEGAGVVVSMLPASPHLIAATGGPDGIIAGLSSGTTYIDMSTVDPDTTRSVAVAVEEVGARMIDAPVSGSSTWAAEGTLTIMVGGDAAHLARAMPVLAAMGSNVHHVGAVGLGCVTKLANQLLVAVHTLAACEAILMGREAGADGAQLLDVLSTSWGASGMLTLWGPSVVSGEFGSRAPMRLLVKDLALVREVAADAGVPLPLGERTTALFDEAMARGLGETDIAALVTLLK